MSSPSTGARRSSWRPARSESHSQNGEVCSTSSSTPTLRKGYTVSPDALEAAQETSEAAEHRLIHQPCPHIILSPAPPDQATERLSPTELDDLVSDLRREMG